MYEAYWGVKFAIRRCDGLYIASSRVQNRRKRSGDKNMLTRIPGEAQRVSFFDNAQRIAERENTNEVFRGSGLHWEVRPVVRARRFTITGRWSSTVPNFEEHVRPTLVPEATRRKMISADLSAVERRLAMHELGDIPAEAWEALDRAQTKELGK